MTTKLKKMVIREELVAITGHYVPAIYLNQFLYWAERVKDFDKFIEEEKRRVTEELKFEPSHGWIFKKAEELNEETMLDLSMPTVRKYLNHLIELGFLEQRRNPVYAYDQTYQYRPNILNIQKALLEKNYMLSGYKIADELNNFFTYQSKKVYLHKEKSLPAIPYITTDIKEEDIYLPKNKLNSQVNPQSFSFIVENEIHSESNNNSQNTILENIEITSPHSLKSNKRDIIENSKDLEFANHRKDRQTQSVDGTIRINEILKDPYLQSTLGNEAKELINHALNLSSKTGGAIGGYIPNTYHPPLLKESPRNDSFNSDKSELTINQPIKKTRGRPPKNALQTTMYSDSIEYSSDTPKIEPQAKLQPKTANRNVTVDILEKEFARLTGLPLPKRNSLAEKKSGAKRWWNPLWEMYCLTNDLEITKSLIEQAINDLRKIKFTISAPQSISNNVLSLSVGVLDKIKASEMSQEKSGVDGGLFI